jgi:hypothetical protein
MPRLRFSASSPCRQLAIAAVLFFLLDCVHARPALAQGQWVQQGPPGGPVSTVVVHPTNPSIVYIGLQLRGVYRSENGGKTWTAVNTGLTDLNVRQLLISPSAPATLFAVTELGIFRTIDGGVSWSAAANVALGSAGVIHPQNPSTLYLYGSRGIYRTTDAGQTWALATTGLTDGDLERIQCMAIDPVTPTTVYACGRGRFFRSTDGGHHWARIDTSGFFRGQTMVVDPVTPTTLYHASLEVSFGGVHRSLDGGVTWTPLLATPVSSVALDPITPSTIYACTHFGGLYKTTDGGAVWNSANVGLLPVGCGVLTVHPLVPTTVYAIGGDGLVRSDNAAASWSAAIGGLTFRYIAGLVADPVIPSTVYALTGALRRSRDMGATWTTLTSFVLSKVAVHPVNPSILYAATTGWDVLRTLDGGVSWTVLVTGIPFGATVYAVAIDPLAPSTVYAGTSAGVYRSTNGGDSWTPANAGLPGGVDSLTIDPLTSATVFATGAPVAGGLNLFRTRDGGGTWTPVGAGFPEGAFVATLAIDPVTPSTLYAGTYAHGVYRTTNGGDTWVQANAGLPPNPVTSVVIDPGSPATIYAGAFRYHDGFQDRPGAGVFRSTNSGATWSPMNSGLTDLSVKLAIEPRSPTVLYAGTESSSVFRWQPDGIRRLAVTNPGSGSGTVTSVPAGIACGEDCLEEYSTGTVVTLSQTATAPSTFVSFGGDADCLDGVVTLSDNRTCTATFNLPAHALTVTRTGAGTGTVTSAPPGIDCGADCEQSYWLGTPVTLTAAPAAGSVFGGWAGDCTGTAPTCQLTIAQARSVTATFNPDVPAALFKFSPEHQSTGRSASATVLLWFVAARADSYETCYDTTDNNLCDGTWTTVQATHRVIGGLSGATTYYWQVRARNITGTTEANSGVWWSFRTVDAPAPFGKALPVNGASGQPTTVTLAWHFADSVATFEYCYDTIANNMCDGTWQPRASTNVIVGLAASTTYYWQVRARNGGTTDADGGVWWSFTTTQTGPAPTVTTHPSNQTVRAGGTAIFTAAASGNPAPTVQWQASTNNGSTWNSAIGATSATYAFTATAADHGKWLRAIFTNSAGQVASSAAAVTVRSVSGSDFNGDATTDLAIYRPAGGMWLVRNQPSVQLGQLGDVPAPGDYNGDGTTDIAVFRPSTAQWLVRNQPTVQFGDPGDVPVPGDYNGDGTTDLAVYRPLTGQWRVRNQFTIQFGGAGYIPIAGDFNGDGSDDIAVFQPKTGTWSVHDQFNVQYGEPGDIPVPGDYNGNGSDDVAVYRPGTGQWLVRNQFVVSYGSPGDRPMPRDYNGDGTTDIAVYRRATGQWFARNQFIIQFGEPADIPAPRGPSLARAVGGDFDGNGNTDVALYRPSTGQWFARNQFAVQFGDPTDKAVPADYDGDGVIDVAVYRPSTGHWFARNQFAAQFGDPTDVPVPGDYNGDGAHDIAVFRPSTGTWYVRNILAFQFGDNGDLPVPGDYNGDGITDLAVYRPSTGHWFVRGIVAVQFGDVGDVPVPGDYNGDGVMDVAVYRPSTGQWFVRNILAVQFGDSTDTPVPGDYNGDGRTDLAVFRQSTGHWFVRNLLALQFGDPTDKPLVRIGGTQ